MQVVQKFIINRNNLRNIYVEKLIGGFNNTQYYIYHNINSFEVLSVDDFINIYGNDEKYSLYDAMNNIEIDLLINNDGQIETLLDNIKLLENKFKDSNEYNPSLWGYRETLLSSIDSYNNLLEKRDVIEEHDYEKDLLRLEGNDIEDLLERIRECDKVA